LVTLRHVCFGAFVIVSVSKPESVDWGSFLGLWTITWYRVFVIWSCWWCRSDLVLLVNPWQSCMPPGFSLVASSHSSPYELPDAGASSVSNSCFELFLAGPCRAQRIADSVKD
jgi:hypothetical protein